MTNNSDAGHRAEFVAGLRALADFVAAHADVPVPAFPSLSNPVGAADEVRAFGAAHGLAVTEGGKQASTTVRVCFGSLEYQVYGYDDWDTAHEHVQQRQARNYADEHGLALVAAEQVTR